MGKVRDDYELSSRKSHDDNKQDDLKVRNVYKIHTQTKYVKNKLEKCVAVHP